MYSINPNVRVRGFHPRQTIYHGSAGKYIWQPIVGRPLLFVPSCHPPPQSPLLFKHAFSPVLVLARSGWCFFCLSVVFLPHLLLILHNPCGDRRGLPETQQRRRACEKDRSKVSIPQGTALGAFFRGINQKDVFLTDAPLLLVCVHGYARARALR